MISKRLIDLLLTIPGLVLVLPIMALEAILVGIFIGYPIFFSMKRPGLDGKIFILHKFRTMTDQRDSKGNLLPDQDRLTKFGRFLRSLSLDELPEFLNVLKGDMSLIGPRPLLMRYLQRYTSEQMRRHHTKPGITGWAQIHGRNALSWEERFRYDVWYVDHQSAVLDLKIIFLTIKKIIKREGITHPGSATMKEFNPSVHLPKAQ